MLKWCDGGNVKGEPPPEHLGSHGISVWTWDNEDLISKKGLTSLTQFNVGGKKERAIDDLRVFSVGNWKKLEVLFLKLEVKFFFLSRFIWGWEYGIQGIKWKYKTAVCKIQTDESAK